MVTKRTPGSASKLKLKKETIRDLDVKRKGSLVKGGTQTSGSTILVPPRINPVVIVPAPIRQR